MLQALAHLVKYYYLYDIWGAIYILKQNKLQVEFNFVQAYAFSTSDIVALNINNNRAIMHIRVLNLFNSHNKLHTLNSELIIAINRAHILKYKLIPKVLDLLNKLKANRLYQQYNYHNRLPFMHRHSAVFIKHIIKELFNYNIILNYTYCFIPHGLEVFTLGKIGLNRGVIGSTIAQKYFKIGIIINNKFNPSLLRSLQGFLRQFLRAPFSLYVVNKNKQSFNIKFYLF